MIRRLLPERTSTGWLLPVGDGLATVTQSSYDLVIVFGGVTSVLTDSTIHASLDGARESFEPDSARAAEVLSDLDRATRLAIDDGVLVMDFGPTTRLRVEPDSDGEAFDVREIGPQVREWRSAEGHADARWDDAHVTSFAGERLTDQFVFISLPGGAVASFTSTSLTIPGD